jgi:hypothetical protein
MFVLIEFIIELQLVSRICSAEHVLIQLNEMLGLFIEKPLKVMNVKN